MNTTYQQQQQAEMTRHHRAQIDELKAMGAAAEIGVCHYPNRHSNVNTLRATQKLGYSRSIPGNDPMAAAIQYAKDLYGSGFLRQNGSAHANDDGSTSTTYFLFGSRT